MSALISGFKMDELRLIIAVLCFALGMYLIYDLFSAGFSFAVLVAVIGLFVVAHYIKPKRTPDDDWSMFWDLLDFIVDIPFKAISLFLRGLGRLSKGDVDGIDL